LKVGFCLLVAAAHVDASHRPVLETLKRLGYDGAEIPVFGGELAHYHELGRMLDDIGLERTFVTIIRDPSESPISPDPAARRRGVDRLRWAIDCGAALGATVMSGPYHSPLAVFSGTGPTEDELGWLADTLREAADHAQAAGILMAIEALNRFECYVLNTMAQASDLRRRVGHPAFTYMYDTFHANIEERDPVGAVERYKHEIGHIHLSENDRGVPGRGHVPFKETIRAIRATGYDGWLTFEAFGQALPELAAATRVWRPLYPDLDTLFAEAIQMVRREWAHADS
jgi:D-psicose/D-tagatose/L-ribulose 3-epimerase